METAQTSSLDSLCARVNAALGKDTWPFFLRRSTGRAEIALNYLRADQAYSDDESRQRILDAMRSLPGVTVTTTKLTGWPALPLADLERPEIWQAYTSLLDDIIGKLRRVP